MFTTDARRFVRSGGGVEPDVPMKPDELSEVRALPTRAADWHPRGGCARPPWQLAVLWLGQRGGVNEMGQHGIGAAMCRPPMHPEETDAARAGRIPTRGPECVR